MGDERVSGAVGRAPSPGETIAGKYRVERLLGRGGMGIVCEATHMLLERRVAVKVLAPEVALNPEAVARFLNEARAAARITSEHVVSVLDVGIADSGLPYIVMELLDGQDVAALLRERGPLAPAFAVDLLVEALDGVAHAHAHGIIHRDLKPSNLFLATRPDRTTVVKVLDFGISKLTPAQGSASRGVLTKAASVLGSPLYMSRSCSGDM
jgi:serine/threonine-protein kinase